MSEQAATILTPNDAAVLILAVLLHDAAMHIDRDGFRRLVEGKVEVPTVPGFDEPDWPMLWDEFITFTVRRWDDRKLADVYGVTDGGAPRVSAVHNPIDRYDDLTESDRRTIGDFLRIHHPRLAHEFALAGVPVGPSELVKPGDGFTQEQVNLAGHIARSHGGSLRHHVDLLEMKYGRNHRHNPAGVFVPYLMALLRVADYIQIQADRSTAEARFGMLRSPLSRREHDAHQSVVDISTTGNDPEAIDVQARPRTVDVFLHLKNWLAGIQRELDDCWAVLGETYGNIAGLRDLGFSYRRIRSNLDDAEHFKAQTGIDYVPERIELDVARAELLRLLIRPLYGNQPSVGVRELLQNAIDAVRERKRLADDRDEAPDLPEYDIEGEVEVRLHDRRADGTTTLEVTDRGVGMTLETIRDYFLRVGASYRESPAWQKAFEKGEEPGTGSTVDRTGRFGIGVLAAFLLGNRITVETRHVNSSVGYRFETTLAEGSVEIKEVEDLEIGSKITAEVDRQAGESLCSYAPGWIRWYFDDGPIVKMYFESRCLFDSEQDRCRIAESKNVVEEADRTGLGEIGKICWARGGGGLYVNSIEVCNPGVKTLFENDDGIGRLVNMQLPTVWVYDPNAKLPIDLQRYRMHDQDDRLKDAVARSALRKEYEGWLAILGRDSSVFAPEGFAYAEVQRILQGNRCLDYSWDHHQSDSSDALADTFSPYLVTSRGRMPLELELLVDAGVENVFLAGFSSKWVGLRIADLPRNGNAALIIAWLGASAVEQVKYLRMLVDERRGFTSASSDLPVLGFRMIINDSLFKHAFARNRLSASYRRRMEVRQLQSGLYLVEHGDVADDEQSLVQMQTDLERQPDVQQHLLWIAELNLATLETETESIVASVWRDVVGAPTFEEAVARRK
ncbi:MAG: ATP-binding protein [Planctomycetota bacterium]